MTPKRVGPVTYLTIRRAQLRHPDSDSTSYTELGIRLSLSCDALWATQARSVLHCLRNALPLDF